MTSEGQQAKVRQTLRRVCRTYPGSQTPSSLNGERAVTMEILLRRTGKLEADRKSKQQASSGVR
jgi:hypothetical protein